MSALAKLLLGMGKKIGGYDRAEGEYVDELRKMGVCVTVGTFAEMEDYSAVVYTDALSESNAALISARRMNKRLISRGKLLQSVSMLYKTTVAVAGCHGKTTCTSMIAHIFAAAGLAFSSHIGGSDLTFTNGYSCGNDYFVTEACEYKKNFLYLKPDLAVILNTDTDHLDCYGTEQALDDAYRQFADGAGEVIKLFGDLDGKSGVTFGFDDRAYYYAKKIKNVNGKYSFTVFEYGKELVKVSLSVYGKHNVLNALAAIAVARKLGIDGQKIAEGLAQFKGVRRRFEMIGHFNGAECIADYAHHPNELRAALKTAKLLTDGNVYVIFQPHTYSRTKSFFKQFVLVLSQVKKMLIFKTYAAREYYDDAGSALTLSKAVKRSVYGDCETDISNFLAEAREGDIVLFLGAGDIYEIAKSIVEN